MWLIEKARYLIGRFVKTVSPDENEEVEKQSIIKMAEQENIDATIVEGEMCEYLGCFKGAFVEIEDKNLCAKHAREMIMLLVEEDNE